MHNTLISRETFDTAIRRRFGQVNMPRDLNLEGIIIDEDSGLTMRHRVIADHLIRRVIPKADVATAIGTIAFAQSRLGSPLRKTARSIEYNLFSRITNHEFMLSLFRAQPEPMLAELEGAAEFYKNDFLFWLQYALFCFESKSELRKRALSYIIIAKVNAYSKMHLEIAVDAPSQEDALLLMDEASETLEGEMRDPRTEAYALTVLAIGRVNVFKKWFPAEVREEARRMVNRLNEAKRKFAGDPEI